MKISFTTLGCPSWDLETICRRGREYGYDAVDFRGLGKTLDVTTLPEFTTDAATTKKMLADAKLAMSALSSSITIADRDRRKAHLEEARRSIDVALRMGVPNIRVFGGETKGITDLPELAKIGADCMREILALPDAAKLKWVFETHDVWIPSAEVRGLMELVNHPQFGVLWDMSHTMHVTNETPQQSYDAFGKWISYTHVKDAIYAPGHPQASKQGWRYVDAGTGELPLAEAVRVLAHNGYDGYLVFEHEKRWLPAMDEPEHAFPAFAKWARELLGTLRSGAS